MVVKGKDAKYLLDWNLSSYLFELKMSDQMKHDVGRTLKFEFKIYTVFWNGLI